MSNNIAMFLDLDNLLIGADEACLPFDIKKTIAIVEAEFDGRVVLRCAYGDYRQQRGILQRLVRAGFQLQSLVRLNESDKNLADIQMVADAVETLVNGYHFQTYILITGDRDFMPLVQLLRRHNKKVVGVGVKHTTSGSLMNLCDDYIFYDDLVERNNAINDQLVAEWLKQGVGLVFQHKDRVQASIFRETLQRISKGEFAKTISKGVSFNKLLEKFPSLVQLQREGTTLYVMPAGSTGKEVEEKDNDLYLYYRSLLKKRRLRVVPPSIRVMILRDLLVLLKSKSHSYTWQSTIQQLVEHYQKHDRAISKSLINDVLHLTRQADVLRVTLDDNTSLANSPIYLSPKEDNLFQDVIMKCDHTYLNELRSLLASPIDFKQFSLALYNTVSYEQYLRRMDNHFQSQTR